MAFPTSPANGQIYKNKRYDSSVSVWKDISSLDSWTNMNITSSLSGANVSGSFIGRRGNQVRLRLALGMNSQTITNSAIIATFTQISKIDGSAIMIPHRTVCGVDTTTVRQNAGLDIDFTNGHIRIYFADGTGLGSGVSGVTGIFVDTTFDLI